MYYAILPKLHCKYHLSYFKLLMDLLIKNTCINFNFDTLFHTYSLTQTNHSLMLMVGSRATSIRLELSIK